MVARAVLLLILLMSAEAFACGKCHKPHYESTGTCSLCHRGDMETSRKKIAHAGLITGKYAGFFTDKKLKNYGEQTVKDSACRRCHVIGGKGGDAAVNLDSGAQTRDGAYLADKIINVNEYMPDFHFRDEEVRAVITYLYFAASKSAVKEPEPYTAYIRPVKKGVFEEKCGPCHRIITRTDGGRGDGGIASNLSGLFSGYFVSEVLPDGEKWDREKLLKWIKNPRSIKKTAVMPPVILTEAEAEKLTAEIQ